MQKGEEKQQEERKKAEEKQPPAPAPRLTSRQQHPLDALDAAGSGLWQRSLEASGFSPAMVRVLETKGWVRRDRRPLSTGVMSAAPLEAARPLTSEQQQGFSPQSRSGLAMCGSPHPSLLRNTWKNS